MQHARNSKTRWCPQQGRRRHHFRWGLALTWLLGLAILYHSWSLQVVSNLGFGGQRNHSTYYTTGTVGVVKNDTSAAGLGSWNNDAALQAIVMESDPVCAIFSLPTTTTTTSSSSSSSVTELTTQRIRTTPSVVWEQHLSQILDASLFPSWHATHPAFAPWLEEMMQYYTPAQLRRSVSHASNPVLMERLLEIVSERYKALLLMSSSSSSKKNDAAQSSSIPEPLRILVTGGSITEGHDCHVNPIGLSHDESRTPNLCAWPHRLEHMFNHGFFQGLPVVEVINLGAGGVNAEVAAITMEYRMFPNAEKLPHVVIYDHSANDARQGDIKGFAEHHLQRYIQAAYSLRPCDDDLPMVVMVESLFTTTAYTDGRQGMYGALKDWTEKLQTASNWYDLMTINYPRVVQNTLIPNLHNETFVRHFMGSEFVLHMGTGFHIGMAWTILFNFLTAFTETCNDRAYESMVSKNHRWTVPSSPLSPKHIGPYEKEGQFLNVSQDWQENAARSAEFCKKHTSDGGAPVCTYAWMAIPTTGITEPEDIERVLNPVLTNNQGWKAMGPPDQPRTGFYTEVANATFTLEILPKLPTEYLTVMSMQSYGPKFVGTKLELTIRVARGGGKDHGDLQRTFQIDPYHTVETSIHVPHKFELPGGLANVGDTVTVEVHLISGSYFKIQGLAFCRI